MEEWAKEEWAKGKEDDLATLDSALRADAVDMNFFRAFPLPLASLCRTHAPACQVGVVDRVPRKDEVSPPWPSPMHSVTSGLQVDKAAPFTTTAHARWLRPVSPQHHRSLIVRQSNSTSCWSWREVLGDAHLCQRRCASPSGRKTRPQALIQDWRRCVGTV